MAPADSEVVKRCHCMIVSPSVPRSRTRVYAGGDLAKAAPKYRFPTAESRPDEAFALVADELLLDGNSRQNLATFCQTWEEPAVHQLMDLAMDKNMIDKDEYPQTAELERRCVHMLADLWNAPEAMNSIGASTIGSSEACMLGGLAAKWRWRAERQAAGKPQRSTEYGVRPGTGRVAQVRQVLGHRDARSADVSGPLRHGRRRHAGSSRREHDHGGANFRGHVHRAPTSWCGRSPMRWTPSGGDRARHRYPCRRRKRRIPGAVLCPDVEWDFRIPRVKSISTSGHKFGLAPLGVGWVVWRDAAELPDDLVFHVSYLGGDMQVFQINFSRPAGQIAAQYYDFIRLGREGYRRVHMASYETGQFLAEEISSSGRSSWSATATR